MSSEGKNNKPDDKVTNISEEQKPKNDIEIGMKKKFIPLINYKLNPLLSSSILNYMAIGISLAIFGCAKRKFFELGDNKEFYPKYFLISGIILYISGILDWYEGKELLYLVDFILAFYFESLYLFEIKNLPKYFDIFDLKDDKENEKLRGTFYIILFLLFLCIAISYKSKGKFYIVDHGVLFIGFIFKFLHNYFGSEWIEKAYSFIFIVSGALFWLTGLLKMIDNFLTNFSLIFLYPSD